MTGPEPRRMQIAGVHHVTAICADADATVRFYRDTLGLKVARDGASDDDPQSRHVWFAAGSAQISFMEYPELPAGTAGPGTPHHFALMVSGPDELGAWVEYLRSRGVETTEVMERSGFHSIYVRDPDGHLVEIATPR